MNMGFGKKINGGMNAQELGCKVDTCSVRVRDRGV